MSTRITKVSVKVLAIGAVTTMAVVGAPAAFAAPEDQESVTQTVNAGSLDADTTVASPLDPIGVSHTATTIDASLNLYVDDTTGSAAGWTVSQQVSAFSNSVTGTTIPAANFSIVSIGDAVDATNAGADTSMLTPGDAAQLGTVRTVFAAAPGQGVGAYNAPIDVQLIVPADSRAGVYTAILTTTVVAGNL